MTEVEEGLALHALLQQAGFDSAWRLTRERGHSPNHDPSLSGYDHMLLRVRLEGEDLWVDLRHPDGGVGSIRRELLDGRWIGQVGVGVVPAPEAVSHEQ